METVLYVIWFLIPLFFLTLALWSKLEQVGGKSKRENPGDFFRQGIFVLVCVLISVAINHFYLTGIVESLSPSFIPLGFYQIVLLPMVLYLAALFCGPSKDIKIQRKKSARRAGSKR